MQLLLEREFSSGVGRFGSPIAVSEETLCLDTIVNVGFGLSRNHLDTEQTLHHFRDHMWCPEHFDQSGWNGPETDAIVLSRMQNQLNDCLAEYKEPDVDPDQLAKMRDVVARAKDALL